MLSLDHTILNSKLSKSLLSLAAALSITGCVSVEYTTISRKDVRNSEGHVIGFQSVDEHPQTKERMERKVDFNPIRNAQGQIDRYEEPTRYGAIVRDINGRKIGERRKDTRSGRDIAIVILGGQERIVQAPSRTPAVSLPEIPTVPQQPTQYITQPKPTPQLQELIASPIAPKNTAGSPKSSAPTEYAKEPAIPSTYAPPKPAQTVPAPMASTHAYVPFDPSKDQNAHVDEKNRYEIVKKESELRSKAQADALAKLRDAENNKNLTYFVQTEKQAAANHDSGRKSRDGQYALESGKQDAQGLSRMYADVAAADASRTRIERLLAEKQAQERAVAAAKLEAETRAKAEQAERAKIAAENAERARRIEESRIAAIKAEQERKAQESRALESQRREQQQLAELKAQAEAKAAQEALAKLKSQTIDQLAIHLNLGKPNTVTINKASSGNGPQARELMAPSYEKPAAVSAEIAKPKPAAALVIAKTQAETPRVTSVTYSNPSQELRKLAASYSSNRDSSTLATIKEILDAQCHINVALEHRSGAKSGVFGVEIPYSLSFKVYKQGAPSINSESFYVQLASKSNSVHTFTKTREEAKAAWEQTTAKDAAELFTLRGQPIQLPDKQIDPYALRDGRSEYTIGGIGAVRAVCPTPK